MAFKRMSRCFAIALIASLFYVSPVLGDMKEDERPAEAGLEAGAAVQDDSGPGDDSAPADKAEQYQILPIPVFITEPAIGNGLGVALTLFHPIDNSEMGKYALSTPTSISRMEDDIEPPPVVTGVFGA